jgi:uncharacterized protein (TIGR04255 family)
MAGLPISLANDTIVECVVEARLSDSHPSAADLLPGLVFGKLGQLFKRAIPLPLGQVPKVIRDQNPQLRHAPTHALDGDSIRMLFGPNVIAVSFSKPYPGWKKVQPLVMECLNVAFDSTLTGRVDRLSIKYVNVLQQGRDEFDLSQTTLHLGLGSFEVAREGMLVRAELRQSDSVTVVEIASGAEIAGAKGVLLSVDSVRDLPKGAERAALPQILESLHDAEKEVFFGLLAKATLEKLGPIYATTH